MLSSFSLFNVFFTFCFFCYYYSLHIFFYYTFFMFFSFCFFGFYSIKLCFNKDIEPLQLIFAFQCSCYLAFSLVAFIIFNMCFRISSRYFMCLFYRLFKSLSIIFFDFFLTAVGFLHFLGNSFSYIYWFSWIFLYWFKRQKNRTIF